MGELSPGAGEPSLVLRPLAHPRCHPGQKSFRSTLLKVLGPSPTRTGGTVSVFLKELFEDLVQREGSLTQPCPLRHPHQAGLC